MSLESQQLNRSRQPPILLKKVSTSTSRQLIGLTVISSHLCKMKVEENFICSEAERFGNSACPVDMIKIKVAQAKENLKFNVGLREDEAPAL